MRSTLLRGPSAGLLVVVLAGAAAAQGANDCASATNVSGFGSFPVSTTSATDSPQQPGPCPTRHNDVWFRWTAPQSGGVHVSLCNLAGSIDTVLAAYSGSSCPTPANLIVCNDDSCGSKSAVTFAVTAGASYMIQAGAESTGATFSGSISFEAAAPPPSCAASAGPDVIVGSLMDINNVSSSGGVDAVSIGTISCNIGTSILSWSATTPAHPVIRQNLYKFEVVNGAGRFQHVGMSWLKHGFAVLPGDVCCACTGSGGGLWPGCSDPYNASTNGNQSSLGPNWQVNANTGAFAYPPASPPFSGARARRCQFQVAEMGPSGGAAGVRYFGEGHYVTADDAAAGNQNNNASWRELTCSAGEPSLSFVGATYQTEQAIRAWPRAESGVTLSDVQIPGDGLLVVGSRATSLGGGMHRYEYAVYNMNADRNVGAFSVPVPAGVTVANVGFHDVAYHDGDGPGDVNFSGLDWVGAHAGGAITWACEPEAANASANAIRWGTLYNFRFDADAPPVGGVLVLGLWKPGTPASVTASGTVPGTSAFNGFCAGDGSLVPCPCGNDGAPGRGCGSSGFALGALLAGSGNASIASDSAVLSSSSMTGTTCVFFQGSASMSPVAVDDGLGCVTGTIVRLATKTFAGGTSSYPQAGDPPLSVRGAIPGGGGSYYYQCFYRNASTSFCPPATSNRTNGVVVTWTP
jgi:hypothetical protein